MKELLGAWTLVSETKDGMAIFTDTHFSFLEIANNLEPFKAGGSNPTLEEAATAYNTMNAAAGSYEVNGSEITFHRHVNRNPSWSKQSWTEDYQHNSNSLIIGSRTWQKQS